MIESHTMKTQDVPPGMSVERRALIDLEQHRGFVDRHVGTGDK